MNWFKDRGSLSFIIGGLFTLIGMISSLVTISTGLGIFGDISSRVLILVIVFLNVVIFRPLIVPNWRGVSLRTAIMQTSLVDIEDRNNLGRHLPPIEFYEQAHQEIAITGITLLTTFQLYYETLLKALKEEQIHVYALLLDPNSADVHVINQNEERDDIREEIKKTLTTMKSRGFLNYRNFEVRFLKQRPSFTSVMIDGNITQGARWQEGAQIRVQPIHTYKTGHSGIILQFKYKGRRRKSGKNRHELRGGFDFFAADVRHQWANGEAHPEYLEHPERV